MENRILGQNGNTPIIGQKLCPMLSFIQPQGVVGVGCAKHNCEIYDRAKDQCSHLTTAQAMGEITKAMASMSDSAAAMTELAKRFAPSP